MYFSFFDVLLILTIQHHALKILPVALLQRLFLAASHLKGKKWIKLR